MKLSRSWSVCVLGSTTRTPTTCINLRVRKMVRDLLDSRGRRIITETRLLVYKELMPVTKEQVDLENSVLWIPDSKTPTGVAELPLTAMAVQAFRDQIALAGSSLYIFPSEDSATGYQRSLRTVWRLTLRRAKVPYFRLYDLRSTYATRLSAGASRTSGSLNCFVRATRRSSKKYSQMKLRMQREALKKMNRQA